MYQKTKNAVVTFDETQDCTETNDAASLRRICKIFEVLEFPSKMFTSQMPNKNDKDQRMCPYRHVDRRSKSRVNCTEARENRKSSGSYGQ
ncbi:hypothetical protein GUITHDRAFT_152410 [Guillardia theta CCMP2712]|uniref:Uncharacterized protein n=1 Tax=Guillardia theta (strain CCMP2712) TaxID=905079 RepID=L1JDH8_GUITC|nr:hypothetical protein GUITHDRAFT_152410 [Guillardia theta CCMP2712]EKX46169.1 hypothetical protein GUITHDRAFT_152410 [Guillardia theta CCMP2712]|mmetsp:Transcript_6283/g.22379  ORF Transcript_6283/g.22379 Transcript_6283/m.22379 type:complete len:90 (+) Transcript_6283:126-395(+)|eukprot:XP_005833149.1 hypothetical protein GUITHDRAFT_152410 [Guillardia theta CCMP2712]